MSGPGAGRQQLRPRLACSARYAENFSCRYRLCLLMRTRARGRALATKTPPCPARGPFTNPPRSALEKLAPRQVLFKG